MADVAMEDAPIAVAVAVAPAAHDNADATAKDTESVDSAAPIVHKKRRVERREKLRKTALCKHFDKPGGCPFPDCKFAHGRAEVKDGGMHTVAAQRQLIREQTVSRAEDKFLAKDATPASLRGTMIERYYTELYSCDTMGKKLEDQYVHMHSNRLCVVGVAPSHPMLRDGVVRVAFATSVLESRVSGKKKKGGQFLVPTTILAHVTCASGATFALRSCVRGALLEVNERLIENPQLLQDKSQSDGYLVIVQPKQVEVAEIQQSLLSKAEFAQFRAIVAAADEDAAAAVARNNEPEPVVSVAPVQDASMAETM